MRQVEVDKWADLLVTDEKCRTQLMYPLDIVTREQEQYTLHSVKSRFRNFNLPTHIIEAILIKHANNKKATSFNKKVKKAFEEDQEAKETFNTRMQINMRNYLAKY